MRATINVWPPLSGKGGCGDLCSACPSRVLQIGVIETLGRMINEGSGGTTGSRGAQVKERGGSIGYWVLVVSILWRLKVMFGRAC